ncbi:hypothetical protein [Sphaerisporangium corydalis]|uniref:Uncharacterized protein n=1 Tax=Sphaerisporangium corydalis TaxID=1441875 RepID=A0ABV9EP90_9ACTN|nr:hypothetical protein [Sphaerisporangium corydalis]
MKTFTKPTAAFLRATAVTATLAATILAGTAAADAATTTPKFKPPTTYGTSFQSDPHHDFTKRISPRHDGILRGWVTYYRAGEAEYEPIRWKKDKSGNTEGWFVGPPEGDSTAYRSRLSSKATFYSALNCNGDDVTANRKGVGTKRCSHKALIRFVKAKHNPALITIVKGKIIKIREIYTP